MSYLRFLWWFFLAPPLTFAFATVFHKGVKISVIETGKVRHVRLFSFGNTTQDLIWISGNAVGEPYKFALNDYGLTWVWGWRGRRVDALKSVAALA